VSGAAEFQRLDHCRHVPHDRLRYHDLLNSSATIAPANLCAKRQQVVLIANQSRAVDSRKSGDGVHGVN
jgi:hypothetical protein